MSKYQAYPKYKDTGLPYYGEIPSEWHLERIKFNSYVKGRQGWQNLRAEEYQNTGPFLVTGAHFNKLGGVCWEQCHHISDKRYERDQDIWIKEHDVLITKDGTIGKVAYIDQLPDKACLNSHLLIIRNLKDKYHQKFLFHLLTSSCFQGFIPTKQSGTTFMGITQEAIEEFPIIICSLDEQLKIATFLDHETAKIDTLIEKQQQLIELLKEKRQAVISHAVTKGLNPDAPMKDSGIEWLGEVPAHWGVINMIHVLNAIGDVDHYMPQSIDKGIPYVMTGDLTEFASGINFDNCKQVSHQDYLKLSNKIRSTKGDVIMARYATIGTVSYIDIDKDFLVSYSCVTIKPNQEKVSGLYLYYYFKSHAFLEGIQSQINTNTQGNVGVNDLKKIKVSLPTLKEQLNIVEYLQSAIDKFDALTQKSQNAINLMQERRTALISAAVTGKIDVRNWVAPTTSSDTNEAQQEVTA
ncbi:restriction endonuclease subunit S [Photobacterium leiognathi]|uniref:restriction endonuclease subunit S n=1 Tax=Photobacterium leiognathi TaxID=553611 RepID=UPI000D16B20C|nr:restriction endonuclease subunit S [Photobacterium leiognathi]PSW41679.1 restriction endonuclease subunit S [Photobacterium leiognathi subsp. mandapamensis]